MPIGAEIGRAASCLSADPSPATRKRSKGSAGAGAEYPHPVVTRTLLAPPNGAEAVPLPVPQVILAGHHQIEDPQFGACESGGAVTVAAMTAPPSTTTGHSAAYPDA